MEFRRLALTALIGMVLVSAACDGGPSGSSDPAADAASDTEALKRARAGSISSVTVADAEVAANASIQMVVAVAAKGPIDRTVTWSASAGTIDASGVFTASGAAGDVTVTATSVADPSKVGSATVTVTPSVAVPPTPAPTSSILSVAVANATVIAGGNVQLTATVSVSGTVDPSVTWSVASGSAGTIDAATGLYTAPPTAGSHAVKATSVADPTKSSSATVTVQSAPAPTPTPAPVAVLVSPATPSVLPGGSVQLTATVTGTTNPTVSWKVLEGSGGAVSSTGLYTAPSSAGTYHVVATSAVDSTRVATATITVGAPAPAPTPTPTPGGNPWPATGTTHLYVSPSGNDGNPGTQGQPFKTIGKAAGVANAGTVVHVAPGTYGPVSTSRSGTSSAPITFVSDTRWGARIDAPGQTNAWSNGGDWVVIQGFELTGSRYSGIMSTANHGRFRGNHIHHMAPPDCSRGGAGIELQNYSETDNDSDGNVIHDIDAGAGCGLTHGIYYQGPNGGRIVNNVIYRTSGWGIHLYHNANHILIANNTVFANGHAGIIVGASLEGNDKAPGIDSGTTVVNNILVGNAGCIEENNSGRTYGNSYVNNTCYANGGSNTISTLAPPSGQARSTVTGTLTSDPQFVNYQPDGSGDYRLRSTSPSANSGTATGAPAYDLDLASRGLGSAVDRGAYESW